MCINFRHFITFYYFFIITSHDTHAASVPKRLSSTTADSTNLPTTISFLRREDASGISKSGAYDNQKSWQTSSSGKRYQAFTKNLESWSATDYRVLYIEDLLTNNLGAVFNDPRISNYTHLVFLPKQSVLYVVGNGATIMKMDMNSFFLLDSYSLPQNRETNSICQEKSCHEATLISVLSTMPNEQMIWYCYVHMYQFPDRKPQLSDSGCMVPQYSNLAEPLVQWDNPHFNTNNPDVTVSILNAADEYTYISTYSPDYLRIFRTHMPDWNGKMNWTGALVTDKSRAYIAEPAETLLTFETEHELYFVLRESPLVDRSTTPKHDERTGLSNVPSSVARLVRICKGDRGGLPHVSEKKFGTFAKSDIVCQSSDAEGQSFSFTRIRAAYWDNATQRLFVIFLTEKWAPTGSALCIYGLKDIEASFNGPVMRSSFAQSPLDKIKVKNSFPNICERFHSPNLTTEELVLGRRLSLTFPNRFKAIQPMHQNAILSQSGVEWIHLVAYDLPALPKHYHFGNPAHATLIWIGTEQALSRIVLYEPTIPSTEVEAEPVVCKLNELHVGQSLNVLARHTKTPVDNARKIDDSTLWRLNRDAYMHSRHIRTNSWISDSNEGVNGVEETIRQFSIQDSKLFITTNRQLLWLPLSDCSRYVTFDQCIESRDPHCGWSWHEARCVDGYKMTPSLKTNWFNTFSPSIDRRRVANAKCPVIKQNLGLPNANSWSEWYICRMVDQEQDTAVDKEGLKFDRSILNQPDGFCRCRVCLSREDCVFGTQEVTNCTRMGRNWLPWSAWSRCDSTRRVQSRERLCPHDAVCVGSSREQRPCWNGFSLTSPLERPDQHGIKSSEHVLKNARKYPFGVPWFSDGVSVVLLLLVALLFLLLGCLISTTVFCLFPTFCPRFGARSSWRRSSKTCASNGFCCKKQFPSKRFPLNATSVDSWSLPDSIHSTKYMNKPILPSIHRNAHYKSQSKKTNLYIVKRDGKSPMTRTISSQNLISLPSPLSNMSSSSTATTVLKDKFTFENIPQHDYDMQDALLSSTTSRDLTETSLPPSPSYGNADSILEEVNDISTT